MPGYDYPHYGYVTPPELAGGKGRHWPVVIVGAGPVGLAAAIDLAQRGVEVLLLDDNDTVSVGSRAICWSKRTLEIFDRLGVGERMVEKGVVWHQGRLFHREREIYSFDLLPEPGHKMPAFINLQQYYVEQYLVDRARGLADRIDLRWKNRVVGLTRHADHVTLEVETPDGAYRVTADRLLACDGAKSAVRAALGLDFVGRVFEERFLIADVKMLAGFPSERWFWFEPPFHKGQSTLLHRQPDDVFRIDFQLGPEADPELERQPEQVLPRIRAMVGEGVSFELEWVSVYSFHCRRLERFVHDRVIFAGDSAHVVSPFGARGGNGGIQDVDNLAWKLALIVGGEAPAGLLASYDEERIRAADENLLNSTRSTGFMTPKTATERIFRDGVLALAEAYPFARRLVNSGRLSLPHSYAGLGLQTPDGAPDRSGPAPGDPCQDAPIRLPDGSEAWLLDRLGGDFRLLHFPNGAIPGDAPDALIVGRDFHGVDGVLEKRYDAHAGVTYLIRPDQHVAARFASFDRAAIARARARASGGSEAG